MAVMSNVLFCELIFNNLEDLLLLNDIPEGGPT